MRLGLMGGTFDPIHNGHLRVARSALAHGLDRLDLVPARQPPHKKRRDISDPFQRYAMAALASAGEPWLGLSALELAREGPSFTIDTVRSYASRGAELYLVIGSDSLVEFDTWRECRELLDLARLLVYPRRPHDQPMPGIFDSLPDWVRRRHEQGAIVGLQGPVDETSSTQLRGLARQGRSLAGHVPPAVAEFISKNRLYAEEAA